jgi:hypothetical protein
VLLARGYIPAKNGPYEPATPLLPTRTTLKSSLEDRAAIMDLTSQMPTCGYPATDDRTRAKAHREAAWRIAPASVDLRVAQG